MRSEGRLRSFDALAVCLAFCTASVSLAFCSCVSLKISVKSASHQSLSSIPVAPALSRPLDVPPSWVFGRSAPAARWLVLFEHFLLGFRGLSHPCSAAASSCLRGRLCERRVRRVQLLARGSLFELVLALDDFIIQAEDHLGCQACCFRSLQCRFRGGHRLRWRGRLALRALRLHLLDVFLCRRVPGIAVRVDVPVDYPVPCSLARSALPVATTSCVRIPTRGVVAWRRLCHQFRHQLGGRYDRVGALCRDVSAAFPTRCGNEVMSACGLRIHGARHHSEMHPIAVCDSR